MCPSRWKPARSRSLSVPHLFLHRRPLPALVNARDVTCPPASAWFVLEPHRTGRGRSLIPGPPACRHRPLLGTTTYSPPSTRERYPHPHKACFVPLSNRCGTSTGCPPPLGPLSAPAERSVPAPALIPFVTPRPLIEIDDCPHKPTQDFPVCFVLTHTLPENFPGGHPSQNCSKSSTLNLGVLK